MLAVPNFNLLEATACADPFPLYQRLRAEDPVHRSPFGMWALSRHADVAAALRDPRFSSRPSRFSALSERNAAKSPAAALAASILTFRDPPQHTRLRKLLARVISDNLATSLRDRVSALADELLAPHLARGEIDLLNDFAIPLPVHVIADMLGIPENDRPRLKRWSERFFRMFAPVRSSAESDSVNAAIEDFRAYLLVLITARRENPGNDVISSLIRVREEGDRLSDEELVASCMILFANGEESFAHLIGNGMFALLRHPEAMALLRDDPTHIPTAIEELVRYDGPAPLVGRTLLEPVELHGRTIPAGSPVYLLLASANRDPERFCNPDQLDVLRADNPHLGFGGGRHACLGAGIARIEAQVAISQLLRSLRDLRLATESPTWRADIFLRGLESLPLRFSS